MQQVNSCSQLPVYRAGLYSQPAKKLIYNSQKYPADIRGIWICNFMLVSSSHPYAIALIMAFYFHLAALLTCYVEHMQYHHVKDRQNLMELSELELELKRFTKYTDITRNIKKNALVQLSSENSKLKGGLFLLLLQL